MKPNIVALADIPDESKVIDTPVDDLKKLYNLCIEMQEVCIAEHGVGLSAVQIGIPWRLFISVKDAKDVSNFRYLINCEYKPEGQIDPDNPDIMRFKRVMSVEGCLSLRRPNKEIRRFKVNRYKKIRMIGKELVAKDKLELVDIDEIHEDDLAIVLQHEIDHQHGKLISNIGEEIYIWS